MLALRVPLDGGIRRVFARGPIRLRRLLRPRLSSHECHADVGFARSPIRLRLLVRLLFANGVSRWRFARWRDRYRRAGDLRGERDAPIAMRRLRAGAGGRRLGRGAAT
jgi:hypothetical protein